MIFRVSTPEQEGVYQGSKWLKFQVLCERSELEALFAVLRPFFIVPLSGFSDGSPILEETFLCEYGSWIEGIRNGRIPADQELRRILACAFSSDPEALWLQRIEGRGYLVKIGKPVVQVQAHWFSYSSADRVFRSMSMGRESIFWGLQFSYPQIYQEAKTMEMKETGRPLFFEQLRHWIREHTRAVPFLIDGQRIHASMRLGKAAFAWIGAHPQLAARGMGIADAH